MRIALPWGPREDTQEKATEYNITFANKPKNFDNLMEFLSTHLDDRFNIAIDTSEYEFDYARLKILNAVHKNLYFIVPPKEDICRLLKENNIRFYFDQKYAAINYRSLENLVKRGVSAVYIADDLCYDLKRVRKACDKYGIELRWILDMIPSFFDFDGTDVRAPIMLPECIDELDKYIDVFEFEEHKSIAKINTLYKIWFTKKEWRDNLKHIYKNLNIDIWNQSMIPDFNVYKMNCGYRCAYGSACKKCDQFKEMADTLFKQRKEYILPKDRKGEFYVFN